MKRSTTVLLAWIGTLCLASTGVSQESLFPGLGAGATPSRWRFFPGVVVGYDSFGQQYSLAERETLDLVDEVSGRLITSLEHHGTVRFGIKNSFGVGQQATRDDAWIDLAIGTGALQFRTAQELHYKAYAGNADFAESSDYLTGITRATALWRPTPEWRLRLDNRLEWTDFAFPTYYSYDYQVNDVSAAVEREYGLFSLLAVGYGYGARSVPDSSVIDFRRHVFRATWDHVYRGNEVSLIQRVERRLYRDPNVRSDLIDLDSEVRTRVRLHPRVRLRPAYRATVVEHDRPDSIYSDATEQSIEVLVEGDVSRSTVLALGPRAEFRRAGPGYDRAYNQWGVRGEVTVTLGTTLWLQFSDELGQRKHLAGEELFFTDYIYNWSTLYASWNPFPRLGFDAYVSVAPEVHEYGEDNTTMLLVSTSVTYGWR